MSSCSRKDNTLPHLVDEANKLRRETQVADKTVPGDRSKSISFQTALRDWIESRVPKTKPGSTAALKFEDDLTRSGLMLPKDAESTYGYVESITAEIKPDYPEALFVTASVNVPLTTQDMLLVYDYSSGSRVKVLEANGSRKYDDVLLMVQPVREANGNHLLLTARRGTTGGSSWNMISYELFRISPKASQAQRIFDGEHGSWFGSDSPYKTRLDPTNLLLEFTDRSIDAAVHSRTHVLQYRISPDKVERIAPIALQPQDFVEEWVSQPWAEVAPFTQAGQRESLKKAHDLLYADFVAGDYTLVQYCQDKPDYTQVGIDFHASPVYFLVHDLGKYNYEMAAAERERQPGCPGDGEALTRHYPSLFPADKQ